MTFSAEGVAAIIVALAGLVSGIYNLMQARRVQALQDLEKTEKALDTAKDETRDVERQLEMALRHIHLLNMSMARAGLEAVPLPKELS
jgi:hypothetical protein